MSFNAACDPAGTIIHGVLRVPAAGLVAAGGICALLMGNPQSFFKEKVTVQSCERVGPNNGMTQVVLNGVSCCMKRDAICSGDK